MCSLIISVSCYENENEIVNFAEQLTRCSYASNIVLLVTCNKCGNKDYLEKRLKQVCLDTRIYDPKDNLGYLNGGLYGIERYCDENKNYEWAIICNTDLTLNSSLFWGKVQNNFYNDDTWCVAPNVIRKSNGVRQNPFSMNRISKKKMQMYLLAYSSKLNFILFNALVKIKRIIYKTEVPTIESGYIYAADGSCFILRKELIDVLLNENTEIFMYGEELLIAGIIYENKKRVYFDSELRITHNENGTTSLIKQGNKQKWFKQSFDYLYRRFY